MQSRGTLNYSVVQHHMNLTDLQGFEEMLKYVCMPGVNFFWFFFHWRTSEGQWWNYFSIFYVLFLFVFKCNMFVMVVMAKASLLLLHHSGVEILIKQMFLRWMKRQSDQLGFNCDLLLMLFLGVYLLLKINQCYHGNEVQSCKKYSSFFTFKQPGDCFRWIFCYIMQASVCLEECISRNERLVCEVRQMKML